MQNEPPRRRPRRRGGRGGARPVRPAAQPLPPPARAVAKRPAARPQRRRPQQQQRSPDDLRAGTPCVILLDCREGEPDRTGAAAAFDGYFDFETGEPRRQGHGIPRLRIAPNERVWGFEVWWRPDPTRAGLTDADREDLETSKRLLRGLVRDASRRTPLATKTR